MKSLFRTTLGALFLMGVITAQGARADVVFDFATMALGNEGAFTGTTVGGIEVVASAAGAGSPVPYLDDLYTGAGSPDGRAGLGVCSSGINIGGECVIPSDDNVTSGETLTLAFLDAGTSAPLTVTLLVALFRDTDHFPTFPAGAQIDIQVDGGGFVTYALVNNFMTQLTGSVFDFTYNNEQFYIETATVSPVPLPAALPLLLSALAGLGMFGWVRRRVAAA